MEHQKQQQQHAYDFDLFVIGGGSGGMGCSRRAAMYGARVGLADYVRSSPQGTTWGKGGTCVNVGCVPKKLFHIAAQLGQKRDDINGAGFKVDQGSEHQWEVASEKIQARVKRINNFYGEALEKQKVKYYNKYAKLVSAHQIELTDSEGKAETVSANYILVASGTRPTIPEIPGKQYGITSDDVFWLKKSPGKTLIIGASYIALETGGFLNGLGCDVTVMVRSILLRGFDQHIAELIGKDMQRGGVKFIRKATPSKIQLNENGKRMVTYEHDGKQHQQTYDTVLFAIGRSATTQDMGLKEVGVQLKENGKVIAGQDDKTAVDNIYAIGDVVSGRLQLTPTAIRAGRFLSERLFNKQTRLMSYDYVATTVFTPIQYGVCGYSEEKAREKFGTENIVVYGESMKPFEWAFNSQKGSDAFIKLIVNTKDNERVVGLHFLGPNAGQVVQGYAVAILMGATREDFNLTVGIHPTSSEDFTSLKTVFSPAGVQKASL